MLKIVFKPDHKSQSFLNLYIYTFYINNPTTIHDSFIEVWKKRKKMREVVKKIDKDVGVVVEVDLNCDFFGSCAKWMNENEKWRSEQSSADFFMNET